MPYFLQTPTALIAPAIVLALLIFLSWRFRQRYLLPSRTLARDLDKCTNHISAIKNQTPAGRRTAAGDVFRDTPFAHHWSEFQETLHDQNTIIDGEPVVVRSRATISASHYFSPQSIVDTPLHTEYFKHLPGILTGLGIIGTFFGLMLGLSEFDPGAPEKVQASVSGLIRDVFFAFIGSLASIACAMVVTHVEKDRLRICYEHLEKLTDAIDRLFDAGVGEEYLAELVRTSQESSVQTRMLKDSLVTDLREMLQNLVETQVRESLKLAETLSGSYRESGDVLANQISHSIESSFREPLEKIAQSVSSVSGDQSKMVGSMLQEVLVAFMAKLEGTFGQQFQGLSTMLEQSVTAMQQMQNGFAALVSDLRSASEASSQTISQQLARTLQDLHSSQKVMQSALNNMVETMQSAVENMGSQGVEAGGKIAAQLERMFADGEARQQKMTDQMEAFVQHMQDSVGRGQAETISQIAGTISQLEQQMQTMVSGIGVSITKAQEDGLSSVSQASEALTARITDMFATFDRGRQDMDQQAQSALKQFQQEAASALGELGNQVKSLVGLVETERHAMRQTVDALGGQTERSLQSMQVGADKMRVAAERFDSAGSNVQTLLQSSGELISSLRTSSSEISLSMRDLSSVVADYRVNRDVTAQSMVSLQSMIERAQHEAGIREKTATDLMRLSEQIHSLNKETEEYLQQISTVVGRSFDEFGHGVERALMKTMGSLDSELDKAVKSLAGGVETVAENIEDLSDVLGKAAVRAARV
ncbi:anti-phage ZorAB system protein ZorA [Pseudoduganella sp. GCM10020061]|uniref:anti-phage ZorAB system protein ZorA n=1 Tax=Pseudoduganella sp. GCM10020061 TaxID=3317345 RepID=UPI00363AF333